MTIIPVINCLDEKCVEKRIGILKTLGTEWVSFDVSDGRFNPVKTWNSPEKLFPDFQFSAMDFKIEVHLMVKEPEEDVLRWLRASAKRPIVHIESDFDINEVLSLCSLHNAELMLAVNPDTPISELAPYLDGRKASVKYAQILGVTPGKSGQKTQEHIPDKVRALKTTFPNVIIEVDGGIDEFSAKAMKEAGADIIVASSYIFENENPKEAYEALKSV